MKLKKKLALIAVGSLVSVGGLYAVSLSAAAEVPTVAVQATPAVSFPAPVAPVAETNVQEGTQIGVADSSEVEDVSDDVNAGSAINAVEDGDQDSESADDATESADDATESAEDAIESADDAGE